MRRFILIVTAVLVCRAAPAAAHPAPFTYLDVRIGASALDVTLVAHVFDVAHDLQIDPPERLFEPGVLAARAEAVIALVKMRLHLAADGMLVDNGVWSDPDPLPDRQSIELRARFSVTRPPGTVTVDTVMFPYDPVHQTFVNFYERDTIATQAILDRIHTSIEFFSGSRQGVGAVLGRFVPLGMRHMLTGPEHLIFLFGLLLLGGTLRHLALVVTAFTGAHLLTLTLAAMNYVTPSLRFVEPGIALSIVYVGADNLMVRGGRDVRGWIASAFGFIHGFGFAEVLRHLNLSRRALSWSLVSFNLGVELAQLIVVVVVAVALAALRSRSEQAGRRLLFAGSILVIATGTVWFIQRVFFPGGMA
jgi:hydrogenase/urease accessory protein HupE